MKLTISQHEKRLQTMIAKKNASSQSEKILIKVSNNSWDLKISFFASKLLLKMSNSRESKIFDFPNAQTIQAIIAFAIKRKKTHLKKSESKSKS